MQSGNRKYLHQYLPRSVTPYSVAICHNVLDFQLSKGVAEESGALKSLQSADQKADNVGTCDKRNNESLENNVTCDDLFPGVNAYRNKYKGNFIFLHVNINSFRHKFAPMQPILSNRKVDLLVISESKLDSTFPNAQFNVDGFYIYRQDYTASSGGLLVYMRSDIAHRRLVQHEINMDGIESMCIEVHNNKLRRVYVCIYKHPSVSDTVFLTHLSQMADRLLIMSWYCFFLVTWIVVQRKVMRSRNFVNFIIWKIW